MVTEMFRDWLRSASEQVSGDEASDGGGQSE